MEMDAKKVGSGGKWGYIGLQPQGKTEIPGQNRNSRFMGYPWQSTVIWTAIFVSASVYVILIDPLYKDAIGAA